MKYFFTCKIYFTDVRLQKLLFCRFYNMIKQLILEHKEITNLRKIYDKFKIFKMYRSVFIKESCILILLYFSIKKT